MANFNSPKAKKKTMILSSEDIEGLTSFKGYVLYKLMHYHQII